MNHDGVVEIPSVPLEPGLSAFCRLKRDIIFHVFPGDGDLRNHQQLSMNIMKPFPPCQGQNHYILSIRRRLLPDGGFERSAFSRQQKMNKTNLESECGWLSAESSHRKALFPDGEDIEPGIHFP